MRSKIEYVVNNRSKLVEKLIMLEDRNNSQFNRESYHTWKKLAEECSNSSDITMFANGYEERLNEAKNSIKIPKPYSKYFEIDTYEDEDDYKYGDEIEGYGCHFLAFLTPKKEFEDKIDVWPILTDDPKYPVVELAGGRLYPVESIDIYDKIHQFNQIIDVDSDESLEEDYQHKIDEWGEPYSYDEVERELKSITNNWTDKEGTIRCYWEQEKNYGLQILKKHYKYVETSDGRTGKGEDMSWVLAYSGLKEE